MIETGFKLAKTAPVSSGVHLSNYCSVIDGDFLFRQLVLTGGRSWILSVVLFWRQN